MKQMALAILASGTGSHVASWLHPATTPAGGTDIGHYRRLAQLAEAGKFDLFFIADTPAARTEMLDAFSRYPLFMNVFEPVTLLSALSGATDRIGLGGTVSTSFSEPYNVARQFASLDHLSSGRAGWNVVTSANDFAARNFGHAELAPHADRYARAQEFVQVVQALWDSWEDGAFVRDRASGLFFDPERQHAIHHEGLHFKLDGALNIERTPQGRPVIIQAGASETGKEFAAETAEVVFASNTVLERSRAFTADLKGRMAKYGRHPHELKVLAGLPVIVADTDAEARERYEQLQSLIHPEVGRMRLGMDLEVDLSDLPLDEPIPEDRIPRTSQSAPDVFQSDRGDDPYREPDPAPALPCATSAATKRCAVRSSHGSGPDAGMVRGRRLTDGFMLNFPDVAGWAGGVRATRRAGAAASRNVFRTDYTGADCSATIWGSRARPTATPRSSRRPRSDRTSASPTRGEGDVSVSIAARSWRPPVLWLALPGLAFLARAADPAPLPPSACRLSIQDPASGAFSLANFRRAFNVRRLRPRAQQHFPDRGPNHGALPRSSAIPLAFWLSRQAPRTKAKRTRLCWCCFRSGPAPWSRASSGWCCSAIPGRWCA